MGVTGRSQPFAQGVIRDCYDYGGHANSVSSDAVRLTGNQTSFVYDQNNMIPGSDAELSKLAKHDNFLPSINKYVLNPVEEGQCTRVAEIFTSWGGDAHKTSWWEPLLRDYPGLKKPLTEEVKQRFVEHYAALIPIVHDEKAATELTRAFVLEMYEQYFISYPHWWRIGENLMSGMISYVPCLGRSDVITIKLVVERMVKIQLNTLGSHSWAGHQVTSAYFVDFCGFRPFVEAGNW